MTVNYSKLDDKELLPLIYKEDENAFGEIYNRYWKRIYATALNYLQSSQAAEDIVQDVFLKIWTNVLNRMTVILTERPAFYYLFYYLLNYMPYEMFATQAEGFPYSPSITLTPAI